jgi:hypothetical protein
MMKAVGRRRGGVGNNIVRLGVRTGPDAGDGDKRCKKVTNKGRAIVSPMARRSRDLRRRHRDDTGRMIIERP